MAAVLRALWYYFFGKYWVSRPTVLTLFVSNICNSRCQHCFYWKNIDLKQKQQISLTKIRQLSRDLHDLELLLISGGEPFLRSDLVEIVKIFLTNNHLKSLSLPTNCLLPERVESVVEKILKLSPRLLVVIPLSLDGDEATHDRFRGVPGNFKKVQDTYRRLIRLQSQYPNLRIRLNATVSVFNYRGLFKLIDQLPQKFPDSFTISLCLIRGDPRNPQMRLPSREKIKKLFAYKMSHFTGKRRWHYVMMERLIMRAQLKMLKQRRQIIPCESGRLLAVVHEDGQVAMCEDGGNDLGNLKSASFRSLWSGRKAKRLRQKITAKQCFCTHEVCLYTSLAAHPFDWWRLAFNL